MSGTLFSNVNNIQSMIPDDKKNITSQKINLGSIFALFLFLPCACWEPKRIHVTRSLGQDVEVSLETDHTLIVRQEPAAAQGRYS